MNIYDGHKSIHSNLVSSPSSYLRPGFHYFRLVIYDDDDDEDDDYDYDDDNHNEYDYNDDGHDKTEGPR